MSQDEELFTMPPCTCDCCQVAERSPNEVEVLSSGRPWRYQCASPSTNSARCPAKCSVPNNEVVFWSAKLAIDYPRHCMSKCKPVLQTVGTKCVRLSIEETELAVSRDGNGRQYLPGRLPDTSRFGAERGHGTLASGSGGYSNAGTGGVRPAAVETTFPPPEKPAWQKEVELKRQQREDTAKAAEREKEEQFQVTLDMRKLVAERLRAEAGAAMAQGAAAGERVRLIEHAVKRNSALVKQVQKAIEPVESGIDASKAAADASATMAEESAREAEMIFRRATASVRPLLSETARLTRLMIEQQTVQAAKQEAKAYASRVGWDKPDNYVKVLSNRAEEPYMRAMVSAVQRVSQYEAYAKTLSEQARVARVEAADLTSRAKEMEAEGETFGVISERRQAQSLLRKSEQLEEEATKMHQIVDETRQKVTEYQAAGVKAGAYVAWRFQQAMKEPS